MRAMAQDAPPRNRQHADSEETIVAEWPVNRRETARVSIVLYRGVWLANIRKWFEADDGEQRPGKGIALGVKHLPQLAEAVTQALRIAHERGLVPEDHGGDR